MKILLSTPFDFDCPGGVNAHVTHLCRELQALGHQTRILSPGARDGRVDDDGHVCRIGSAIPIPANGSTARIALSPFLGRYIRAFLEEEQFDILHLHDPLTSTLHLSLLANSNAVNIGTFHASNSSYLGYNLLYRFGRPLFSWFNERIDERIAVSPVARDFISHYFPGDYRLVPNGIDFDAFGPSVPPVPDLVSDEPTVLFVGRFDEPRKGFRYLLPAMSAVQQEIPAARLLVAGRGNRERFIPLIKQQGVRNVTFLGEVPPELLPALYASCHVFCAPSTGRESFGIVLLEAMASAKPVVATAIDGYRRVARDNREALLVPPYDSERLADALVRILSDQTLGYRLANAGRERARTFSWPTITRRVVECYEEARRRVEQSRPSPAATSSLFSSSDRP